MARFTQWAHAAGVVGAIWLAAAAQAGAQTGGAPGAVGETNERVRYEGMEPVSVWAPENKATRVRAVFVALHGIQSNQRWYGPLGTNLAQRGFAVWAFTRPHKAPERPLKKTSDGKPVADAASWKEWIEQLDTVRAAAVAKCPGVPVYAMGVSWGARPVLKSLMDNPDQWAGAVVLNPALELTEWKTFLFAFNFAVGHLTGIMGIPLDKEDYTANEATQNAWLKKDQLTTHCTTEFFGQTKELKGEVDGKLDNIKKPVLALLGEVDPLVLDRCVGPVLKKAAEKNPKIKVGKIPDGTHAMILENPGAVAKEIERWVGSH